MVLRVKLFIYILFSFSVALAIMIGPKYFAIESNTFMKALLIYLLFSTLYSHLKIIVKKGNTNVDYGLSYSLSIALFAGPLGLLIFELSDRFAAYINRKITKTADPDEFIHTFYNIGSSTLNHSIAFLLYFSLYPSFQNIPFGFWLLITLMIIVVAILSDLYLITMFTFMGDIKSFKDAIDFVKTRSMLDMAKLAVSNGLLFIFLQNQQWEMLTSLFILNYLVSRSFHEKSESIQNKIERDKFKQMAYTDFLTEVYNRAFMDKKMDELNDSGEYLGIIVADIDTFKRINDTYNHAVGDRVIQHFAATLLSYLDEHDFLFRSGGEEFTIFLRNKDYDECVKLTESINKGVEKNPVNAEYLSKNITIYYTSSFGLYYYKTNETVEIKKAYVYADQLLYRSKDLGKNKVSVKNGLLEQPLSVRFKI